MNAIKDATIHRENESILEKLKSLLILMQKHNMKKESILCQMAEQDLAA